MDTMTRRQFVKTSIGASALLTGSLVSCSVGQTDLDASYEKLDQAAARPVLKREYFTSPVIIESIELLEFEGDNR